MRKFSKFEIATIKRTAQNVAPMVSKKRKIEEKMVELQNEYKRLVDMQEQYENSIRTMTGGYSTEDLVTRVIETTNSVDKNGNHIKVTKYVLKYPDTIIPVAPEYECDNVIPGEIEEPIDDANMMNE
jgi:hypothetical protein